MLVILDAGAAMKNAFLLVEVWNHDDDSEAEANTEPPPEQCRHMLCDPENRAILPFPLQAEGSLVYA